MKKVLLILLMTTLSISLLATEYVVKISKSAEVLPEEFWISRAELNQAFDATIANARSQGVELDPYFDNMYLPSAIGLKVLIVPYIVDEKIVDFYAAENNLFPSESAVESETEALLKIYTSDPNTLAQIEAIYGSMENFRAEARNYIYQSLKSNLVQSSVAPLDEEALNAYFEQNIEELRYDYELIMARHILVTDEATATMLYDRIEAGEITFGEAALQYSIDSGTAANGGQLGYLQRGQTVPEFEEAILTAPIGTLYGPVKTDFGYHLIIVEERDSLESLQELVAIPEIYSDFVGRYQNDAYGKWVQSYKAENDFGFELLDDSLLVYDQYMKVMYDEVESMAMVVELAAKLFGPNAKEESIPAEYAVFVQLSDLLGLTSSPNYELAVEKLYFTGEKRGLIVELMYRLKGDDPVIAAEYFNTWLVELEMIFANPQLLQDQLSQYGQSFVDYVFNTISEIDLSLGVLLGRDSSVDARKMLLNVLLRNNALALELNADPLWQEEKLSAKLYYLEEYFAIEPSEILGEEISATRNKLETLQDQNLKMQETEQATSTN